MTLDELSTHALYPFQDFRENDASFLLLELYWTLVAQNALTSRPNLQVEPLQDADQDREHWGDPVMLDFWCPAIRRGIKVILLENDTNQIPCRESEDKFNCMPSTVLYFQHRGVTGPDDEIDQLCFCADMSIMSRQAVGWGIRQFIGEGASIESIEDAWDRYIIETGDGPTRAQREEYYMKYLEDDDDDDDE